MSIIAQLRPQLQDIVRRYGEKLHRCAIYDRARITELVTAAPTISTALTTLGYRDTTADVQRQLMIGAMIEHQTTFPDIAPEDEPLLTPDYMGIIHCAARQVICHRDDEQYQREVERDLYDAVMRKALQDTGCQAEATSRAMTACAMLPHVVEDLLEGCAGDATVH